jgi:hypothetical protein
VRQPKCRPVARRIGTIGINKGAAGGDLVLEALSQFSARPTHNPERDPQKSENLCSLHGVAGQVRVKWSNCEMVNAKLKKQML